MRRIRRSTFAAYIGTQSGKRELFVATTMTLDNQFSR
jgi:hypothetical protein